MTKFRYKKGDMVKFSSGSNTDKFDHFGIVDESMISKRRIVYRICGIGENKAWKYLRSANQMRKMSDGEAMLFKLEEFANVVQI